MSSARAKAGDTQIWQGSSSVRRGDFQSTYLTRNDGNAQLNIDVPLASRRNHFLPFVGEFSTGNTNAAVDRISDFGTLKAFGYGLNWTPIPGVNPHRSSHTKRPSRPDPAAGAGRTDRRHSRRGAARFPLPARPSMSPASEVAIPALVADNRQVTKVGLTLKPFAARELTITANYIKSDIDNAITVSEDSS